MSKPSSNQPAATTDDERIAWEQEAIAEARDDIRKGFILSGKELDQWFDRWVEGGYPLPLPGDAGEAGDEVVRSRG